MPDGGNFMTFRVLLRIVVLLLGGSRAHGLYESYLEHTVLCLDRGSVQVFAENMSGNRIPLASAPLAERLYSTLGQILESSHLKVETKASCVGSSSYTLLYVVLRKLDPQLFTQYPEGSIGFTVDVQVGFYAEPSFVAQFGELPNLLFAGFIADVRPDGAAGLDEIVHAHTRELVRDLAIEWWEDNPPTETVSTFSQFLRAGFVLLSVLMLLFFLTRRTLTPVKTNG